MKPKPHRLKLKKAYPSKCALNHRSKSKGNKAQVSDTYRFSNVTKEDECIAFFAQTSVHSVAGLVMTLCRW